MYKDAIYSQNTGFDKKQWYRSTVKHVGVFTEYHVNREWITTLFKYPVEGGSSIISFISHY